MEVGDQIFNCNKCFIYYTGFNCLWSLFFCHLLYCFFHLLYDEEFLVLLKPMLGWVPLTGGVIFWLVTGEVMWYYCSGMLIYHQCFELLSSLCGIVNSHKFKPRCNRFLELSLCWHCHENLFLLYLLLFHTSSPPPPP